MTGNQDIYARVLTRQVIESVRRRDTRSPQHRLLLAIEDAISTTHDRLKVLEELGQAGSVEYLQLSSKIADWSEARRINR